jgi:hypothetical protein
MQMRLLLPFYLASLYRMFANAHPSLGRSTLLLLDHWIVTVVNGRVDFAARKRAPEGVLTL